VLNRQNTWLRCGAILAVVACLGLLAGCATAPATGETIFTGGLTESQEREIGAKEHRKILAQFGGVYDDPELAAYVTSIGNLLVRTSETPNEKFTFTVLDTPIVNAFATPGGYVYITRGLLTLANDEAELSGVLAHEIGHITARHSAERYGSAVAATVAQIGLGIFLGGEVANLGGQVAAPLLQSFSREQEFEADVLGVRYMSRAGYDPQAMGTFLSSLQNHARLEAEIAGRPGAADAFNIMQTHPRTSDRIDQAIKTASSTKVQDPMRAAGVYLDRLEGVVYGDSPAQGYVRGRSFSHPELGFTFTVPDGFRLRNEPHQVVAEGPNDARIIFSQSPEPSLSPMTTYLRREWLPRLDLVGVEAITLDDMEAATGATRLRMRSGQVRDIRFLAVRYSDRTIYHFLFATRTSDTESLAVPFRRTTYSFRRLSAGELAELDPYRIRQHQVRSGETVEGLAQRLPFERYRVERFRVVNGLGNRGQLQSGETVKLILEQ
jgi:predicted Zn-dependent protease